MISDGEARHNLKLLARKLGVNEPKVGQQQRNKQRSQTDPFFFGSKKDWEKGKWFADVWRKAKYDRSHLRGVHYWLVAKLQTDTPWLKPDGEPYRNTDEDWKLLEAASKAARWLGLVNVGEIKDRRNSDTIVNARYPEDEASTKVDEQEILWQAVSSATDDLAFTYQAQIRQPYHLELYIEKYSPLIEAIASKYGANLTIGQGHASITQAWELYQRASEIAQFKPVRIFYMSDFDMAGDSMPKAFGRKLEAFMRDNDLSMVSEADIRLYHILLTKDQVVELDLPSMPVKESAKKTAMQFEKQTGIAGQVELDALEDEDFRRIVTEALDPYYDHDLEGEIEYANKKNESSIKNAVEDIIKRRLEGVAEEIEKAVEGSHQIGGPDFVEPEADEGPALFDSKRDYLDQLKYYNRN